MSSSLLALLGAGAGVAGGSTGIFTEGFESGNLAAWDVPVTGGGASALAVVPTAARTGNYGLHIDKPFEASSGYTRRVFPATDSCQVSGSYRWLTDSGSSATNGTGPRVFADTSRIFDVYRQDLNGKIWLRYASTALTTAGSIFVDTGLTVALNTWVKLAVRCDYAAGANSRIQVWVNDVRVIDQSSLTVFAGAYTALQLGSEHTQQYCDLDIDDVTCPDTSSGGGGGGSGGGSGITTNSVYVGTDRKLHLVADDSIFDMRGNNVHTKGFSWSQSEWNSMAAAGYNSCRLMCQWRYIEPTRGNFDETEIGYVTTSIARAAAAGIKCMLLLCITTPQWSDRVNKLPGWTYTTTGPTNVPAAPDPRSVFSTASLMDCMVVNGEAYVREMVSRFYPNPNVIGFEFMNEPDHWTSSDGRGITAPAYLVQRGNEIMLNWARTEDLEGDKLWFVATTLYSSQNPLTTPQNNWGEHTNWRNLVFQHHCYFAPQTPTDDGYQSNGMHSTGDGTFWNGSPEAVAYDTANKASMQLTFAPWKAISQQYGVPWVLGETGVPYNKTTPTERLNHIRDITEAAELQGAAGAWLWCYNITTGNDRWSTKDASANYRPEYLELAAFDAGGGGGSGPPPATAITNDFEAPAGNAIALTTANSGGGARTAFAAVSATAGQTVATDTAVKYAGAQSAKFATGATAGQAYVAWTHFAGATTINGRAYVRIPATLTAFQAFFRPYSSSTSRLALGFNTSNRLQLLDSALAQVAIADVANAAPLTTWVRVEWQFNFATGAYTVSYFATPGSTTATQILTGTGATFGGTATEYRLGCASHGANLVGYHLDNVGLDTAGPLGP
jgi:hypothetical protein